MPATMISIRDLHLTLNSGAGSVHILRGINLDIQKGEAMGLVGPSGSGKTSLMTVMAGIERFSSGSVKIADKEIGGMSEDELARFRRQYISIVFQSFHLIPTMTALENVAVPLEIAGVKEAFARAQAELGVVGLAHRLQHYPGQLSGGEQQRVALARAMAPRPALILADEPTGNLDTENGQAVIDLMFRLHDEYQTTLLLITHDRELAKRCDRMISMHDGNLV